MKRQKNTTGNIDNVGRDITIGDQITNNYSNNASVSKELTETLPRLRSDQIIGRKQDLKDLHDRLFANKQVVLVNGMGGIGKTTLAQVYLTEFYDKYQHIAWVDLSEDSNLENALLNTEGLLTSLGIQLEKGMVEKLSTIILMRLKQLKGNKPCLLVLDNATEDLASYYKKLPNQPHWHILVTSRERIPNFEVKKLGFLNEEEALELFQLHYKRTTLSEDFLKELVKDLEYHTLTIEILAKTAQFHDTSPKQLLKILKDDLPVGVATRHNDSNTIEKLKSYLCSILKVSQLTWAEQLALKYFACLPPDFHKLSFIEQHKLIPNTLSQKKTWWRRIIAYFRKSSSVETKLRNVLNQLANKGWLLYNNETDSYKVHRIVIGVLFDTNPIEEEEIISLIEKLSALLEIDPTKDNPVDKFPWVTYGTALLSRLEKSASKEISTLQNNLALVLQNLGDYAGAKKLLEKALAFAEWNLGEGDPITATYYLNLSVVLQGLGDYAGARKLLEKALAFAERNFGYDHPNTATCYSNLALILTTLGDYVGAKDLLEKALASVERNFGDKHPTTATYYSNLGSVLQYLGDYVGAKELLEKALASAERNFGESHPTTAISYSKLAMVLQDLGDYAGAKELLEKALASAERNFGDGHPTTAISYSNLALVLQDLGDYEGAKDLLERALASDERNFGDGHPNTAISYSNLGSVLQDLGDYAGAKELLEKALASDERNFGDGHPTTAISYSKLGSVLKDLGDYAGAKELLEKALASDERNFGDGHPTTAVSYSKLGIVLQALGDYAGAKELLEKALTSDERNFGDGHPTTAVSYLNLGIILRDLKQYKTAKKLLKKAYQVFKTKLGENHPHTQLAKKHLNSLKNKK